MTRFASVAFPRIYDQYPYAVKAAVRVKMPHVRKLVYTEDGIFAVVEADAERYQQIDRQLIERMKSLINRTFI